MEYDDIVCACALNRIFIYSCDKALKLLQKTESASEVFRLKSWELKDFFGEDSHFVNEIQDCNFLKLAEEDVKWAERNGARIYYYYDKDYPKRLKECCDAPILFFYKGNADLNHKRVISVVGTRKATPYGVRMCQELLRSMAELEKPPIVVSGLAYGIDVTAHQEALNLGMSTIGVMATGLDRVYPSYHKKIALNMMEQGGLLTDFPIKTSPVPLNFIRRNRLIAGLSDATILVESDRDGGGVITSKMAHSYNRDVFAYPGRVVDDYSSGCNMLIRENIAEMITGGNSVRRSLGWRKTTKNLKGNTSLKSKFLIFESDNEVKRKIVEILYESFSATPDELYVLIGGCTREEISISLTELELEMRIKSDFSGRFTLIR